MDDEVFHKIADTLLSGRYSLLLGAGASLDSQNGEGAALPSGRAYLEFLAKKKTLPAKYSLQDIYSMVTDTEKESLVTRVFARCTPGPTALRLTEYLWSRVFTLNIDDAFEAACESVKARAQQQAVPIHFKDPYIEPSRREQLHVIHLHGITRRPSDGYVFSKDEYIRLMKAACPWMTILSQFIRSEPFIIAGTSLDEFDLHYYLSFRESHTNDVARAPSILIEPFPDAMTEHKCKKYSLELFRGTILEFFDRFAVSYPIVPRIHNFVPVSASTRFTPQPLKNELGLFLGDFEFVERAELTSTNVQSSFLFGGAAVWEDYERRFDVERRCTNEIIGRLRKFLNDGVGGNHFLICDNAGGGKNTIAGRILYDLACDGAVALRYKSFGRPNIERAVKLIGSLSQRAIVHVDNAAEAAPWLATLIPQLPTGRVVFLLTERTYREDHARAVLSGIPIENVHVGKVRQSELKKLMASYSARGLLGNKEAEKSPGAFANRLKDDPIALVVCRILNDFRSIDQIAASLLSETDADRRFAYLATALATLCHPAGVRWSILRESISHSALSSMAVASSSLPVLVRNNEGLSYVTPLNRALSERILVRARIDFPGELKEALFYLGEKMAPYVSRQTIMQGTPEARASRRLFNYDEVVTQFAPRSAEEFYEKMEPFWSWNSRYWEQKALLRLNMHNKSGHKYKMTPHLRDAVAHARHANTIETHPFPLTTLGNVLMAVVDVAEDKAVAFSEAFGCFDTAISIESARSRVSIQPLLGIMKGTMKYCNSGHSLSDSQVEMLQRRISEARTAFPADKDLIYWSRQVMAVL